MDVYKELFRRPLIFLVVGLLFSGALILGCRGTQARVMHNVEADKVGSDRAGAEVYNPMVKHSVGKLLGRAATDPSIQQVSYDAQGNMLMPLRRKVCFIGLENKSMEELGDFKEFITTAITEKLAESDQFDVVSYDAVSAGLRALQLRPTDLFLEDNMRMFVSAMGRGGTPVDYMIKAKLTSGTTEDNKDMQRDYKLTIEMIDTRSFTFISESMMMRKEYNRSAKGKIGNWFKK